MSVPAALAEYIVRARTGHSGFAHIYDSSPRRRRPHNREARCALSQCTPSFYTSLAPKGEGGVLGVLGVLVFESTHCALWRTVLSRVAGGESLRADPGTLAPPVHASSLLP